MENRNFSQGLVAEMNLCRSNPGKYSEKLEGILKFYHGKLLEMPGEVTIRTQEGRENVVSCIRALKGLAAVPVLLYSETLTQAAELHASDTGPKGITGHTGSNNSSMSSRIERFGEWNGQIGENIDYGNSTPERIVFALLIDDGVPSRGHRENILNPRFLYAGSALAPHTVYRFTCVTDFAQSISGTTSIPPILSQVSHQIPIKTTSNPVSPQSFGAFNDSIFRELNSCRLSPSKYSEKLQATLQYYQGNILAIPGKIRLQTQEGPRNVQSCINALKSTNPVPALQISVALSLSAKELVDTTGARGLMGDQGEDFSDRISRYGDWSGRISEIMEYGGESPEDIIMNLLIDDGSRDKADRLSLLSNKFNFVGICAGAHASMRHMCVIDLAERISDRLGQSEERKKRG